MNIVISGAGRGIGFDTALKFSQNKANRILALSRNLENLKLLKETAVRNGFDNIDILKIDVTQIEKEELEFILSKYIKVDILINNAGILYNKAFLDTSIDEWKSLFDVNLFGVVNLTKALIPYMNGNDLSHIINIGSMGGFQGTSKFPGLSAYCASKAALGNLTECLAEELKNYKINVNCLALGAVNTEMLSAAFPSYEADINSNEIADFIMNFCMHSASFFNGKILPVSISTP